MTYNLRIGPLKVQTPGITYHDLGPALNIRTKNVETIEAAVITLASATRYENVPTLISLDGNALLESKVDATKIIVTTQTLLEINTAKFNGTATHNINVIVGEPLPFTFVKKLKEIGVSSLIPKISVHGFDACIAANRESFKHGGVWPSYLINYNLAHKSHTNIVPLSTKQQQIAHIIATRGLSNRQLAIHFRLTESTIKMHIGIILKKYGVQSRTQLVLALQKELI
jgi:DNA-binding CsgD family transcriptional regulator